MDHVIAPISCSCAVFRTRSRMDAGQTWSASRSLYVQGGGSRPTGSPVREERRPGAGLYLAQSQGLGAHRRSFREEVWRQAAALALEQREGAAARADRGARRALLGRWLRAARPGAGGDVSRGPARGVLQPAVQVPAAEIGR